MSDKIPPALSPEEWDFWFEPVAGDAPRIQLWNLLRDPENHHYGNLHKIAALALLNLGEYGIEFGFTHEDVRALRGMAGGVENDAQVDEMLGKLTPDDKKYVARSTARLNSLADRIEALLPPESREETKKIV